MISYVTKYYDVKLYNAVWYDEVWYDEVWYDAEYGKILQRKQLASNDIWF